MARLAVLVDRSPEDREWKGAFIWRLILALAESQHEVLALTTLPPETIPITHPRLSVARPADSWRADRLPQFAQALFRFRPQIIHTFALKPQKLWHQLTLWPYLDLALKAFPQVRRISTLLDGADIDERDSSWIWHQGSHHLTIHSPSHESRARSIFTGPIEVAPLELEMSEPSIVDGDSTYMLIPAPVSEWTDPESELLRLAEVLSRDPDLHVRIVGGWGDALASERRRGWETLAAVAGQVHMTDPVHLPGFVQMAAGARSLWLGMLPQDSWRAMMAGLVAEGLGKEVSTAERKYSTGSTANFISRLYTLNC